MFVDASALVAILTNEPEAARLADAIEATAGRSTSPLAIYETVAAIVRKKSLLPTEAHIEVMGFLTEAEIDIVAIAEAEVAAAVQALQRFGRGTGHPARLNMGDCFAYACARTRGQSLLFAGEDFVHTDIRPSLPIASP